MAATTSSKSSWIRWRILTRIVDMVPGRARGLGQGHWEEGCVKLSTLGKIRVNKGLLYVAACGQGII